MHILTRGTDLYKSHFQLVRTIDSVFARFSFNSVRLQTTAFYTCLLKYLSVGTKIETDRKTNIRRERERG